LDQLGDMRWSDCQIFDYVSHVKEGMPDFAVFSQADRIWLAI
jgi:hypothetical protein